MGLYHIKELLSGRCSSRVELIVSDLVSDSYELMFNIHGDHPSSIATRQISHHVVPADNS